MPEGRTNYFARVGALLALGLAFVLVVATIATNGGGSGDDEGGGSGDDSEQTSGPTRAGERALEEGVWIVGDGDTLVFISESTGIDLDELVELNPDIDPQALIAGQRISLRAGEAGEETGGSTTETDAGGDPADEFGDGSVDGDN